MTVRAAAKAVIELFVRNDVKRRGFFIVEWAAAFPLSPGAFEFNAGANQFNDIRAAEQVVDKVLGYQAAKVSLLGRP